MKSFEIVPLKGVGELTFGMTPDAVMQLCGVPARVGSNSRNEREEQRDAFVARYDESGLVELAFVPNSADIQLGGVQLFAAFDPIAELLKRDPKPVECFGFIVFLDLGITITGYHDGDVSQRAVTVFPKGRWDSLASHFKPFCPSM